MTRPSVATIIVWAVAVLVPLVLVFNDAGHIGFANFLSLSAGVLAFNMMAANLFLAARPPILEGWLGGLDRVYALHRQLGIGVFVLVLYHANFDIEIKGSVATSGLAKLSVEAAELVYPLLAGLLAVSFIKRLPRLNFEIPYGIWRWSHRVVGVLFLVIVFHQFFVKAPYNNNATIATYTNVIALIGIASFLWSQVAAPLRSRSYEVTHVRKEDGATVVQMAPKGRGISPSPGQFAFISFAKSGLREPHPFSVSAVGPDKSLEFSIKSVGDFTRALHDRVAIGDQVAIEGGYGRFNPARGSKAQIWVAGGIGITPFLAAADSLSATDARAIDLFYCVRNMTDAIGLDRLRAVEQKLPNFRLHVHCSGVDGRLDAGTLIQKTQSSPSQASFWFCGPTQLKTALLNGLKEADQMPKSVHFEKFEFR